MPLPHGKRPLHISRPRRGAPHHRLILRPSNPHQFRADRSPRPFQLLRQNQGLVISTRHPPRPMQRNRNKHLYLIAKSPALQRSLNQRAQHRIKLRPALLKRKYHVLETLAVHPGPRYPIDRKLLADALPARPLNKRIPAHIAPAPPAIIASRAPQQLLPATPAKPAARLKNALPAANTNRRPQQMIQPLPAERSRTSDSTSYLHSIHPAIIYTFHPDTNTNS